VGIEGTFEPVSGKDTLAATGHFHQQRWSEDFRLVENLGIAEFRYPIPWQIIERERGRYRWSCVDRVLASAHLDHGLSVIADPLHHTSYPSWLEGGFLNPEFVSAYANFVEALAARYPWITTFTPFNEPTCTLDFCGDRGFWHPYARGDQSYVTMLRHTARAAAEAVRRIRRTTRGAYILHVDTFERHAALDAASEPRAHFLNERRFLFEELLMGRVDRGHPLFGYLLQHGFSEQDLAWHREHPIVIDERGGNYYPLNEEQLLHGRTHAAPSRDPVGFSALVLEYAARLPYPLSLTETNIQGTVRDRISWFKYMLQEVEKLQTNGTSLRRFAWYPLFDCCGWQSLLQAKRWSRDPQGIYCCDEKWNRLPNEFTRIYQAFSAGLTANQIPGYRFTSRHDQTLGPLKSHMNWEWVEQHETQPPAHSR
jgi:beta-glucosidase